VSGTRGSVEWQQEHPQVLSFKPLAAPAQVFTPNGPGNLPLAARSVRIVKGHPEGFPEAFANLYSDAAEAIAARLAGAAAVDVARRRIPNAIAVALLAAGVAAQWAAGGWPAAATSAAVALGVGAALAVPWSMRLLGGGDLKLAAATADRINGVPHDDAAFRFDLSFGAPPPYRLEVLQRALEVLGAGLLQFGSDCFLPCSGAHIAERLGLLDALFGARAAVAACGVAGRDARRHRRHGRRHLRLRHRDRRYSVTQCSMRHREK